MTFDMWVLSESAHYPSSLCAVTFPLPADHLASPLYSISAHNLFLPSAITCQHHTEEALDTGAGHVGAGA